MYCNRTVSFAAAAGFLILTLLHPAVRANDRKPSPRPLGDDIPAVQAHSTRLHTPDIPGATEPDGPLTLRKALILALGKNPGLAASAWEIRAAEARMLQAGLLPNPEIKMELEEFGGSGDLSGFDNSAQTLRVSQLIELGGKRGTRRRLAELNMHLASWDYELDRLTVFTQTALAFIDLLAAQEQKKLADMFQRLSDRNYNAVVDEVTAGKASPLDKLKAAVEKGNSRIDSENAARQRNALRVRLSATWGNTRPLFTAVQGNLEYVIDIPPFDRIQRYIRQNPQIARWSEEMNARLKALALERRSRIPDLTLNAGLKRFNESKNHSFVIGLGFSLPLFDRNQGNIREAESRIAQTRANKKRAELAVTSELRVSYEALMAASREVTILKKEILPAAEAAFAAAREGYKKGKFRYLELLDAQRTLFRTKSRYVDALASFHRAVVVVESLIGIKIEDIQNNHPARNKGE